MRTRPKCGFYAACLTVFIYPAYSETLTENEPGLSFAAALHSALVHAPTLIAQQANVAAARATAVPAAALPDPKLVIGAENVPISGPDQGHLDRDFMTMEKIGVMQDIPNADKRQARMQIASATIAKASAEREIERLSVREATAMAWLNRYFLEQRATVLNEFEQENQLLTTAVHAQRLVGKGTAGDVVLPAQEAAELADRRDELAQAMTQAKAELKRWIGDDAYLPLAGDAPVLAFDPMTLHQHLHHHPELAAYGPMTDLATAEIREAAADKKSDWGVELDYQHRAAPFSDMVSVEFTFGLPVFSGSRQTPRINAKRHALEQLDAERDAMLREHTAQLDSDLAQYTRLDQQLTRLRQTRLPLAQQKIDLEMASYRAGQGSLATVLSARRERIETRLREIELTAQKTSLMTKLFFAYGQNTDGELAP